MSEKSAAEILEELDIDVDFCRVHAPKTVSPSRLPKCERKRLGCSSKRRLGVKKLKLGLERGWGLWGLRFCFGISRMKVV